MTHGLGILIRRSETESMASTSCIASASCSSKVVRKYSPPGISSLIDWLKAISVYINQRQPSMEWEQQLLNDSAMANPATYKVWRLRWFVEFYNGKIISWHPWTLAWFDSFISVDWAMSLLMCSTESAAESRGEVTQSLLYACSYKELVRFAFPA